MSIRAWSNDYVSGFSDIDAQHKKLFQMINAFAEENNESVSNNALVVFLDSLWDYCIEHFSQEEELMEKNNYPLIEYHAGLHKNLKRTIIKIKDQLRKNTLKEPYITVISFSTDWLNNHIAKDDLTFFNFCKNKNDDLSKQFVGRACEVSTMGNEVLGIGRIESIQNNDIVIANATDKRMPVNLNDMVKVSSFSAQQTLQIFIAQVFYSTPETVKLFNTTIIKTLNNRKYFRVPTNIEAILWSKDESFPIIIADISAGGLKIESDQLLELHKK